MVNIVYEYVSGKNRIALQKPGNFAFDITRDLEDIIILFMKTALHHIPLEKIWLLSFKMTRELEDTFHSYPRETSIEPNS